MAEKSPLAVLALRQGRMIRFAFAVFLLGIMNSACQPLATKVAPVVEQVDVPQGLYLPEDGAIAFRVRAEHGTLVRSVELPLEPFLKRGVEAHAGFVVYALSNGRHRVIGHREQGNKLVADLIAGKTYIVALRLTGRLAESLAALCRWRWEATRQPKIDIPKICTQILCTPGRFSEKQLFETFGVPGNGAPPVDLGGWDVIPRDLCERCTRPTAVPPDLGTPVLECLSPPGAACSDGQVLFNGDFEADTVGNPPSTSPAGAPPGDSLAVSGDVAVVSSTSNAVRLARGNIPAVLEAVLDTGATNTGSYCIRFAGQAMGTARAPAVITFLSTNGSEAWRLVVDEDSAELTSGAMFRFVELDDFSTPHRFRFDMDLDLGTFDMFIDGNSVVSGLPLLNLSFDVPEKLQFSMGICILECFESTWTVDDITITKTD